MAAADMARVAPVEPSTGSSVDGSSPSSPSLFAARSSVSIPSGITICLLSSLATRESVSRPITTLRRGVATHKHPPMASDLLFPFVRRGGVYIFVPGSGGKAESRSGFVTALPIEGAQFRLTSAITYQHHHNHQHHHRTPGSPSRDAI